MELPPEKQQKPHNPAIPSSSGGRHRPALIRVLRARTRLIVCLWTLPVYVVGVWILLNNTRDIGTLMYIYMGIWAVFAVDMARRYCPACHQQFFVKSVLLNLITRRCVHCGLELDAGGRPGGNG